jgi:bifunctional UDP-N-acetylglucosamine pyrophosphorylase/glucosamine-1-phosphate N-acetyltransferase
MGLLSGVAKSSPRGAKGAKKPSPPSSKRPARTAPANGQEVEIGPLACIVLAAGKGTRMKSARAKVLHTLLGAPLCAYPIDRARELGADPVVAVLGHQRADVEAALAARYGGAVAVVEQTVQRGTGHAVQVGLGPLEGWPAGGLVLVLYGDAPLLKRETISALVQAARRSGRLAILTAKLPDPTGYGRIVRDLRGRVRKVVEEKDCTSAQRRISEINAGFYAAPIEFLRRAVAALQPNNAQGELYLTDIVETAARSIGAETVLSAPEEIAGINDRRQLVDAEEVMRKRIIARFWEQATFRDADSTVVEPGVEIGSDVEIGRNVSLRGRTRIADGVRIDDGVILTDTEVAAGVEIKAYSVATESVIGPGAKIGPFAHLRPGSELGPDVHVGNFVETKKVKLGRGSKANHLTYLGDAVIGEKVNVGAGTITCNYNGYEKRQTIIEDGAFIGSDSQLVAPVRIGRRAVVAAGTTVVQDVPPGALAISRVQASHIPGYADKVARRYGRQPPEPQTESPATPMTPESPDEPRR